MAAEATEHKIMPESDYDPVEVIRNLISVFQGYSNLLKWYASSTVSVTKDRVYQKKSAVQNEFLCYGKRAFCAGHVQCSEHVVSMAVFIVLLVPCPVHKNLSLHAGKWVSGQELCFA